MRNIPLPDPLYAAAERAAKANGLSVEVYVQEALQTQLDEDSAGMLTLEQVTLIGRAEAEIDAGDFFTADQVREHFDMKSPEWTTKNPV